TIVREYQNLLTSPTRRSSYLPTTPCHPQNHTRCHSQNQTTRFSTHRRLQGQIRHMPHDKVHLAVVGQWRDIRDQLDVHRVDTVRSAEHTSELQSREDLVRRLL